MAMKNIKDSPLYKPMGGNYNITLLDGEALLAVRKSPGASQKKKKQRTPLDEG